MGGKMKIIKVTLKTLFILQGACAPQNIKTFSSEENNTVL
jgi:hypothetical protein